MVIKYHRKNYNPVENKSSSIDSISTEMILPGTKVLDIGCATGYIAEYLQKYKDCSVVGVENNPEQAQLAQKICSVVFVGSIESQDIQFQIDQYVKKEGLFNCVYMSEVIEHLIDPWKILRVLPRWIQKDGCLVITTCNVAHWRMRIELMKGKWAYQEYGILDKTHLKFFTYETFRQILLDNDYQIIEEDYKMSDFNITINLFFYSRSVTVSGLVRRLLGDRGLKWYKSKYRNLLAYQMAFKCIPQNKANIKGTQ
jgi:2-polyprenyl-3-methyl-5-hydroxy-6-metoxy-1,4-benzoquinol methylase